MTGNIDAQLLAILIVMPTQLSAQETDGPVRTARFAQVADWLDACIVQEHPPEEQERLRIQWMGDEDGRAARAGWILVAA